MVVHWPILPGSYCPYSTQLLATFWFGLHDSILRFLVLADRMEVENGKTELDKVDPDACSVRPQVFKTLVGRNHPEFSTMRQQDTAEYYRHLIMAMDLAEQKDFERLQMAGKVCEQCNDGLKI